MHPTFSPFEGSGLRIVSHQEAIDRFPDLARRGKTAAAQVCVLKIEPTLKISDLRTVAFLLNPSRRLYR
jgi:hypothetical protein